MRTISAYLVREWFKVRYRHGLSHSHQLICWYINKFQFGHRNVFLEFLVWIDKRISLQELFVMPTKFAIKHALKGIFLIEQC